MNRVKIFNKIKKGSFPINQKKFSLIPHQKDKKLNQRNEIGTEVLATVVSSLKMGSVFKTLGIGAFVTGFVSSGMAFSFFRYKISNPNQCLVRTGLGIKDMVISKTGMLWPFQKYKYINMNPENYTIDVHAMSNQKMEFVLPSVFTIGPKDDNESLIKFARYLLEDSESDGNKIVSLIRGIVEGETRVLAAQMTIDEIFNDRATFKKKIYDNVQEELNQFGLKIFNANIKELQDTPGSEYFTHLRQKTKSEAEGTAKINISEAKKNADIGVKQRELETRKQVAQYEAEAIEKENETKRKIIESNTALEIVKANTTKEISLANIESEKTALMREVDLQKEVDQRRIAQETERMRSVELSKAIVQAEKTIKISEGDKRSKEIDAEANLFQKQKEAEALLFQKQRDAEGNLFQQMKEAEGSFIQKTKESDAHLYQKDKEAKGIELTYNAQSEGVTKLLESFKGDSRGFTQFMMFEKNLYPILSKHTADAIHGLNPKISVWNTGSDSKNNNSYTDVINNLGKSLVPMVDIIHQQTGMNPMDIFKGEQNKDMKLDMPMKV
jgi:flotillin